MKDELYQWRFTRQELSDLWRFCQCDFERFLDLLDWMDENMGVHEEEDPA